MDVAPGSMRAGAAAPPLDPPARREGPIWAAFAALLLANYFPTFRWMVARWEEEGSYMSHGWLIPPSATGALWHERAALRAALAASPGGSALGWLLLAPALLLHLVSGLADVSSISGLTLIPMVLGFVILRFGVRAAGAVWFPVGFLAFMVPPPEFVISTMNFSLKLMASDMAAWVLNMTGLPAIRTGSYMLFGQEKLAIGDVCSGLRSLLALLSIGVLYAWIIRGRGKAHVLAVLLAMVPAAIVGNGLRIGMVCYLVHWLGQDAVFKPLIADWDLHLFSGAIIFAGALGILIGVTALMDALRPAGKGAG